jgi:cell wall-associated NlpC family hydrolase
MTIKFVPCALLLCACATYSLSVFAQNSDTHSKQNKQIAQVVDPSSVVGDDPVIISAAENALAAAGEELKPSKSIVMSTTLGLARFQPLLTAAIDERLGSRYRWGSTGPNLFDCSGFVWSTFHSVGIDFERSSARTLWSRFEAPAPADNYKFGTLVFFTHLSHVGIVADENGFYHASRHHGVVYAPFNGYWGKHIDGFRRVPLPAPAPTAVPSSGRVLTN